MKKHSWTLLSFINKGKNLLCIFCIAYKISFFNCKVSCSARVRDGTALSEEFLAINFKMENSQKIQFAKTCPKEIKDLQKASSMPVSKIIPPLSRETSMWQKNLRRTLQKGQTQVNFLKKTHAEIPMKMSISKPNSRGNFSGPGIEGVFDIQSYHNCSLSP